MTGRATAVRAVRLTRLSSFRGAICDTTLVMVLVKVSGWACFEQYSRAA